MALHFLYTWGVMLPPSFDGFIAIIRGQILIGSNKSH